MARQITSQFWIGIFDSETCFHEFFAEDDAYISEENEHKDDYPLSRFAASQGEIWYDHDFLEPGFNDGDTTDLARKFSAHSWVKSWAPLVKAKMKDAGLESINAFALMGVDTPRMAQRYYQIARPRSHHAPGIDLVYIGELTHDP